MTMRRKAECMAWDADADARLRELWAGPLSTLAIGAAMGVTKNAVVGRAHRLKLPPRPSPIRSGEGPAKGGITSQAAAAMGPRGGAAGLRRKLAESKAAEPAAPAPAVMPKPRVVALSPVRTCQWIEGPAAGAATVFCGAVARQDSSYCPAHHARCFTARVGPASGAAGAGLGRTVGWSGV